MFRGMSGSGLQMGLIKGLRFGSEFDVLFIPQVHLRILRKDPWNPLFDSLRQSDLCAPAI